MDKNQDAINQAAAQFESIKEMVEALESADDSKRDEELERLYEFPLSLMVRDGWRQPGAPSEGAEEYEMLLCWGGPAVRLRGALDQHDQPRNVVMEWQDWGTPWTVWRGQFEDGREDILMAFVREFYFGA